MKLKFWLIGLAAPLCACGDREAGPAPTVAESPAAPTATAEPELPDFVGRVWRSVTLEHPPGTVRVFLPNRTLVMASCVGTYRLAEWGIAGDNIRWREGAIPIEAAYEMPSRNELVLRIVGREKEQLFVESSVPYACPEV